MENQATNNNYFGFLTRRTWLTWLWSGLVAIGLNLAMFLVLPHMVDPDSPKADLENLIPHVNVVRLKRPETEVHKPPAKPPEPPKVQPKQRPQKAPTRQMTKKLVLPFEMTPRLPAGPGSIELPAWEGVPLSDMGQIPGTFDVGQLDGPLTSLARIPPVYPIRARRRSIEGWVKVAFIVDESGKIGNVSIVQADPPGLFEKSVEQCVLNWKFKPGTVGGMPVRTKVETTIRFELE